MGLFARFFRLVWGSEVDRALRPVLAVSVAGSTAFAAGWSFVGIWAVEELGASKGALGAAFLVAAIVGMVTGYAGGHLSDYVGRKPMILVGWVTMALTFRRVRLCRSPRPPRPWLDGGRVRVASNLGVTLGPPIGGLLLIGRHWSFFFFGIATLTAVAIAIAVRYLPTRGEYSPEAPPTRGSFGVIRRDHAFLLFLLSGALAYLVYVAIETVLPVSAVHTYGISPAVWGVIVILNPLLVTLSSCASRGARRASLPGRSS